jgi:hypothetical protein
MKDFKALAVLMGLAVILLLTHLAQPLRVLATDALGNFSASGSFNNSSSTFAAKGTINGCDPEAMSQADQGGPGVNFLAYGVAGCTTIPSSSTNHEGGGVFGAVSNASVDTNAVGGPFYCQIAGDGIDGNSDLHRVRCWGINPLVSDHGYNHTLLMNELDYNVTGPDTKVVGFFSSGASTHQPASGSVWQVAGPIGPGVPWPTGYACADGGTVTCLQIGPTSTGINSSSQLLRYLARDSNGVVNYTDVNMGSGGGFFINMSAPGGAVRFRHNGVDSMVVNSDGGINPKGVIFASLGAQGNGTMQYCVDCVANSNPCTGFGTGGIAKRLNGAWDCR